MERLLVGSQDTSHLPDYPSFGIIAQRRVSPCTSVESEPVEPQL